MIDLRSDTVTKPTPAMRQAMAEAEVGDDVFNEDPSLNALQEKVARWFGHEASQPGDELICAQTAHVYR